jgi:hypothetical protein
MQRVKRLLKEGTGGIWNVFVGALLGAGMKCSIRGFEIVWSSSPFAKIALPHVVHR